MHPLPILSRAPRLARSVAVASLWMGLLIAFGGLWGCEDPEPAAPDSAPRPPPSDPGYGASDMSVGGFDARTPRPPIPTDPNRPPRECGPEICDTPFDESCDGVVDEGCLCTVTEKPCYSGDPRDLAHPNSACRMGVQRCQLETYGACTGEVLPTQEICNGLDDDCDGIIDEDTDDPDCPLNAAPLALCPPDQSGPPLVRYALEGGYHDADGDPMVRSVWRILEAPPGSTTRPDDPRSLETAIFADLQGEYVLELEVEDRKGKIGRCTTRISANSSNDDFRVEMVWSASPQGDDSDVDLHLKRSPEGRWHNSGLEGDDCHWRNCSVCRRMRIEGGEEGCREHLSQLNMTEAGPPPMLQWTPPISDDDPRLDLDDVHGYGPENVNIRRPTDGTWRVGVHYWDPGSFDAATVTVRIFCARQLVYSSAPTVLHPTDVLGGLRTEFWEVADVIWREGSCEVRPLGSETCPRVCLDHQARDGGCPADLSRGQACP